jgi:DNA topoisomerase-3
VETHNSVPEELKALFPSTRPNKNGAGEATGKCPRCGGNVAESYKGFFCDNKACKFAFFKESKYFTNKRITLTKDIATALLAEGRIFLKGLYSEKSGKTYNATIVLDDKVEGYPAFAMEFESKGGENNG